MGILNVFGFFAIFCISSDQFNTFAFKIRTDVVTRQCKNLENLSPLLRLKRHLFCDYDTTIPPNYPKTTNVTLTLMPMIMNFKGRKLSLHSLMLLIWTDPQLAWTPSDYNEITLIRVNTYQIWTPDLTVNNSGDMSTAQHELPVTNCLLYSSGSVTCVPAMKFISRCDLDCTYWPYAKQQCSVTFISWMYIGKEVDLLIDGKGINMTDYMNDTVWDFKFIDSMREVKKYKCCPNATFPSIKYNFLLTHFHGKFHTIVIVPTIAMMLLTLIVSCLDLKSVERMAIASANLVCHLVCMYNMFWYLPFNGVNTPNIMLFYGESLTLTTFAIIITAFLRKLENMSTEIPNWISFTTTFVLSNKAGRFLILKDESKMIDGDITTEENSDIPKSEISMKKSSWKYFADIIDWLAFICVILSYAIILLMLVPTD